MKKYNIEIKETLARVITVKANSEEEAFEKVQTKYNNEKIVLDSDDFCEVEFLQIINQ